VFIVQAYTGEGGNMINGGRSLYGVPVSVTNIYVPSPDNSGESILGPYNFYYTAPGSYTPTMQIMWKYTRSGSGYGTIIKPGQPTNDHIKTWSTFTVYQKAVSVTTISPGLGTYSSSHSFPAAINYSYTFDKSANRGDAVSSYWTIENWNGSNWVTASPGVDYNIISGSLGNPGTPGGDSLVIQFLISSVNIRVGNYTAGTTSGSAGTNTAVTYSQTTPYVAVPVTVTNTVLLPVITETVVATSIPSNTVINLNPLEGRAMFQVEVTPVLNISNVSYQEVVDYGGSPATATNNLTLTIAEWETYINTYCTVVCNVYDIDNANTIVQQANGLITHIFTLPHGNYKINYIIT
jgi:hypothetical protein